MEIEKTEIRITTESALQLRDGGQFGDFLVACIEICLSFMGYRDVE
jgi:hypothetical protein